MRSPLTDPLPPDQTDRDWLEYHELLEQEEADAIYGASYSPPDWPATRPAPTGRQPTPPTAPRVYAAAKKRKLKKDT